MKRRPRLVVLARLPVPGVAKTRLIPALAPRGAANICRELVEHTVRRLRPLDVCGDVRLVVRVDGPPRAARAWLGRGIRFRRQGDGDLGERLKRAFDEAFGRRVDSVVVVGSDCPRIAPEHVREALARLESADLVLGPAADGGYYLIALRRSAAEALPRLLAVEWSTERVLRETLDAAQEAGLRTALLEETLADVDVPEDLGEWQDVRAEAERRDASVSVIVPALDEQAEIARAVRSAVDGGAHEVIVADGGSRDGTRQAAAKAGARVIDAPRGRARQMNAGAAAAKGDILLFLHADTLLPPSFSAEVRRALTDRAFVAGAFTFGTDCEARGMAFVERTVGWRSRQLGMPYGDQAQFVRADVFRALGGFPDLPVMEDYELMQRLRRLGWVAIVPEVALTSGRVWDRDGVVLTTAVNKASIWGYRLGVPPKWLASLRSRLLA
jgi:rSAM/selenodomain-associated transferase 2/rSAM/selenodomain-associated transferase 1